jgi:hypothetical protein
MVQHLFGFAPSDRHRRARHRLASPEWLGLLSVGAVYALLMKDDSLAAFPFA